MDATERGQMATFPIGANYVRARAALLDVLEALGPLRSAAVLVGAQAVYEYTRNVDEEFAVSPFTLDADLAFLPELLADDPKLSDAMESAGFEPSSQPLFPCRVWDRRWVIHGQSFVPRICSIKTGYDRPMEEE